MGVTQPLWEVSSFASSALIKHAEFITRTTVHTLWLGRDYDVWENNIIKPLELQKFAFILNMPAVLHRVKATFFNNAEGSQILNKQFWLHESQGK